VSYACIAKNKTHWPVTLSCEVLQVSTSGFFDHLRRKDKFKPTRPGASKRISNEAMLVHNLVIHAEVKQEYGWPKMGKELVASGIRVGDQIGVRRHHLGSPHVFNPNETRLAQDVSMFIADHWPLSPYAG
jgi:hypothetical protein